MKIMRTMNPPRASTITTSASQPGNPFFSSHHNAGVKWIARVAARKIGASTSLEDAANVFGYSAGSAAMYIAFGANAAVGDFAVDVVLDSTSGITQRAFLQSKPA